MSPLITQLFNNIECKYCIYLHIYTSEQKRIYTMYSYYMEKIYTRIPISIHEFLTPAYSRRWQITVFFIN